MSRIFSLYIVLTLFLTFGIGCNRTHVVPGGIDLSEPRLMTSWGHAEAVLSLAVSSDGEHLLTGSADYTARFWDVSSRKELWRFVGHEGAVIATALSPDGKTALTGGEDRKICMWNLESGVQEKCFEAHGAGVLDLEYAPDGSRFASASEDGSARIWEATGALQQTLKNHTDFVESVSFSQDGKQVVTASLDGTAVVWEATTGQKVQTFRNHKSEVWDAVFSPADNLIASASADRTILRWRVRGDTVQTLAPISVNWTGWESLAFAKDGQHFVAANSDKTARVFRTSDGVEIRKLEGHTGRIWSVVFDPKGRYIATASGDRTVRLWSVDTGKETGQLGQPNTLVTGVAFSPDQKKAFVFRLDHTLYTWQTDQGAKPFQLGSGDTGVSHFSTDGNTVLVSGPNDTAILWDTRSGRKIQSFVQVNKFKLAAGAVSPDGKWVAFGETDGTVSLYQSASGALRKRLGKKASPANHVAFSGKGDALAASLSERDAVILDINTGAVRHKLKGHKANILDIDFSEDGTKVVTGSRDGTAMVWDAQTGAEIAQIKATQAITIVRFSPDGGSFLTVDTYGNTQIWGTSGSTAAKLSMPGTTMATFSPDGNFLLSGTMDGAARIWDVDSGNIALELTTLNETHWIASTADGKIIHNDRIDATPLYWMVNGKIEPFAARQKDQLKTDLLQTVLKP